MKDEVVKSKTKINMLEYQLKESKTKLKSAFDDIKILENTLKNKSDEIEELNCELDDVKSKKIEETEKYSCFSCEFICESNDQLKEHLSKKHKAKPDATHEMNRVKCPECVYRAESKYYLEDHILDNHNFPCGNCSMIFRNLERLDNHMCKQEIKNPTFESFYSKSGFDINGCNPLYCSAKNQ